MLNIIIKTIFHIVIFLIALFFILFLSGVISTNDIISILHIDTQSNSGKAITNLFLELKLVTKNLFSMIFEIINIIPKFILKTI